MEEAFEQYVPDWLLLVTSPPLLEELMDLAQRAQTRGLQQVQPHRISRLLARCTAKSPRDFKLDEDVHYTGAERRAAREYLIHTAVVGQAESLITEDEELNLPGNLSFSDPRPGSPYGRTRSMSSSSRSYRTSWTSTRSMRRRYSEQPSSPKAGPTISSSEASSS